MKTRTKIYTAFLNPGGAVIWPYVEFDEKARRDYLLNRLKNEIKDIEFVGGDIIRDFEELREIEERADIDGILVYALSMSMSPHIPWFMRETDLSPFRKHPMIVTTDFLGGIPYVLDFCNVAEKEKLPVLPIQSSNFEDVKSALHLIKVIHSLKESKILSVEPSEVGKEIYGSTHRWKRDLDRYLKTLEEVFGVEVVRISGMKLNEYYQNVDENSAEELAQKWIDGATKLAGPNRSDILAGSKMCLALEKAVEDVGADAVIVDFVPVLRGEVEGMPCLAVPYLRDRGIAVGPEGDMNSGVVNLLMYYLTGRMGFVNDPVIDTYLGQEWCCHCAPPLRWKEKDSPPSPYELRYACHHTAVVPVVEIPTNEIFTSVGLNVLEKKLAIHQGKSVGRVIKEESYPEKTREKGFFETVREKLIEKLPVDIDTAFQQIVDEVLKEDRHPGRSKGEINIEERACTNRFVFKVKNAKKIFDNMTRFWDTFGWHRSIFCGDYRKELLYLAALLGLEVIEEDK